MMERASQIVVAFLATALWQITLLVLAVALCEKLGRRRSLPARNRHLLLVVTLILSVALPLFSVWHATVPGELLFIPTGSSGASASAPRAVPLVSSFLRFIAEGPRRISISERFSRLAFYFYLVFLLCRLGHFCFACLRAHTIRRAAIVKPLPEIFAASMERARQSLSVFREPALCVSPRDGPMTCGIRTPVIIVPEALLTETSPAVITSVLGHEMAHIQRHDFLLNLIYEFLLLPVSFHPAAWFMKQKLRQTRELACDEMIAGPLLDPPCYAQSLLSVIQCLSVFQVHSCGLGTSDTRELEERLEEILSSKLRTHSARTVLFVSLIILGTVSIAGASFPVTFVRLEQPALPSASEVSIPQARQIAMRYMPGEVVGEEISRKKGDLLYSFYIRTETGITEVYIKAASGEVVRVIRAKRARHEMPR